MAGPYANLAQNRVTRPGQNEVIRQTLYDYQIYPTAGLTAATFFQTPIGQGQTSQNGGTAGAPKTLGDTNLRMAGTIPAGNMFRVESIEVPFYAGSVSTANLWVPQLISIFAAVAASTVNKGAEDALAFYTSGHLQLFILAKPYLDEAPLLRFPPKAHIDARIAVASNSATTGEVLSSVGFAVGRAYMLKPEITLTPVQNFAVSMDWIAAVATPSGFNARFGVVLDGILERSSQ